MSDPTLMVLGKRRGPRPIKGVRQSRRASVWMTEAEYQDLQSIAAAEHKSKTDVMREAIDCYVGDFRERPVFKRPNN